MEKEDLIGVWELISCQGDSKDDHQFLPYGPKPVGRLIYEENGTMSVLLMTSERKKFASADISKATPAEIKAAFESFDAYSGTWHFDQTNNIVEHQLDCGRIPNWVGHTHKRMCTLENGNLILKTEEFEMMGAQWIVSVTWQRPKTKIDKRIVGFRLAPN